MSLNTVLASYHLGNTQRYHSYAWLKMVLLCYVLFSLKFGMVLFGQVFGVINLTYEVNNAGVGKSCLLLRFSDGSFTTSFITTIGLVSLETMETVYPSFI